MSEKSASFKKGKGNVEHNNREEKIERDNIDNERTKNNIQIGKKIDLREFYEQTFGQAVKDYNEKQTREDRKIGSYYDKISSDSKKNSDTTIRPCWILTTSPLHIRETLTFTSI